SIHVESRPMTSVSRFESWREKQLDPDRAHRRTGAPFEAPPEVALPGPPPGPVAPRKNPRVPGPEWIPAVQFPASDRAQSNRTATGIRHLPRWRRLPRGSYVVSK